MIAYKKNYIRNTAVLLLMAEVATVDTTTPDIAYESVGYFKNLPSYKNVAKYKISGSDKPNLILRETSTADFIVSLSFGYKNKFEQEVFELFGEMRDLNQEERRARKQTMENISINTGVALFDI